MLFAHRIELPEHKPGAPILIWSVVWLTYTIVAPLLYRKFFIGVRR